MRRAVGTRRVGHTGTLDPLATGVLPLVIGTATRLASLLSGDEKVYEAGVRIGAATDTYDAASRIGPPPAPPEHVGPADIDAVLGAFRGTFAQTPPPYSAKKIQGVRAYTLARRNEPVQPRAVDVTVSDLSLVSYEGGLARLRVTCSAGFYVRSLAHDLGERLGSGAYLESLRRIRAGGFDAAMSVALERIEAEGTAAVRWLIPLGRLLPDVPAVVLNERGVRRASHGNELSPEDLQQQGELTASSPDAKWRLMDGSGTLLGIAETRPGGTLHPVIVLV